MREPIRINGFPICAEAVEDAGRTGEHRIVYLDHRVKIFYEPAKKMFIQLNSHRPAEMLLFKREKP
jgi:hypothetical protein